MAERGLQKAEVAKTVGTAGLEDDQVVKLQYLSEAEVSRHRSLS